MMEWDAIIIGSGPNGLAAAIHLQQKGLKTLVLEQASQPGGSTRTRELTLKGVKHDVGSAVHPLAVASPFFRELPLEKFGLEWVVPDIPFSHPFPDGSAISCYQDLNKTAGELGADEQAFMKLFGPLVKGWDKIDRDILGPLTFPSHPMEYMKFGLKALPAATFLANRHFEQEKVQAFFYGAAAHSVLPLNAMASSSFGVVLITLALKYGWPFPKGGAGNFIDALLGYYKSLGGELKTDFLATDINELPAAKAFLFDLTPKQLLQIKGTGFTQLYRKRLLAYEYGAGIFKLDWALKNPIPFINENCRHSGTLHIGFSSSEIEDSEKKVYQNKISETPFVLLVQPSIFDGSRTPDNLHTAWAYCHVPNGSRQDCTTLIEAQIEKVAPGFKKLIVGRSKMNCADLQQFNPNIIGGDINGGKQGIKQLFTRPVARLNPYGTPDPKVYICSSSTPPGGGVHGMCGFHAAQKVLKDHF